MKGDILCGYWNTSEVQSLVYIIDNSLATKCYMAKMETFGCRMRVSGFCRVSCVPASCVLIWFVSCPRLMWLLVNLCPAVFVLLSMIYLCIYSPVCSVWFCLVYSLLPVFPVCQPCLVLIKDFYLSLRPRLRVPPSCVHRDRERLVSPMPFSFALIN